MQISTARPGPPGRACPEFWQGNTTQHFPRGTCTEVTQASCGLGSPAQQLATWSGKNYSLGNTVLKKGNIGLFKDMAHPFIDIWLSRMEGTTDFPDWHSLHFLTLHFNSYRAGLSGEGGYANTASLFPKFNPFSLKEETEDFPGGPMANTLCSQRRAPGFNPWSGN